MLCYSTRGKFSGCDCVKKYKWKLSFYWEHEDSVWVGIFYLVGSPTMSQPHISEIGLLKLSDGKCEGSKCFSLVSYSFLGALIWPKMFWKLFWGISLRIYFRLA